MKLSEQELREIDAEATAVARDLYGDGDGWSAYGCGYKAGVIAERQRHRAAAEGERRDGLARLDTGPLGVFYAVAKRLTEIPR